MSAMPTTVVGAHASTGRTVPCLVPCRWAADAHAAGGAGRVRDDESSGSDEDEGPGRAEELRRERLTALVKRNLTAILLDVTDALFGGLHAPRVMP